MSNLHPGLILLLVGFLALLAPKPTAPVRYRHRPAGCFGRVLPVAAGY